MTFDSTEYKQKLNSLKTFLLPTPPGMLLAVQK